MRNLSFNLRYVSEKPYRNNKFNWIKLVRRPGSQKEESTLITFYQDSLKGW